MLGTTVVQRLLNVVLLQFATQMLAPSKATTPGLVPTVKAPSAAPSLARSLLTVLLLKFATQMLAPSKATPLGPVPTAKLPDGAPAFHPSRVIFFRMLSPPTRWLPPTSTSLQPP